MTAFSNPGSRRFGVGRRDIIRHGIDALDWYTGAKIVEIERRGKCVVFATQRGENTRYVVAELGMSGLLLFRRTAQALPQHTHLILKLNGVEPEVRYWNARRFGRIHLYDHVEIDRFLNSRYGPDPLSLSFEAFAAILHGHRGRLKALLMHQQVIAGIGNIYANEMLFDARFASTATSRWTTISRTTAALRINELDIAWRDRRRGIFNTEF